MEAFLKRLAPIWEPHEGQRKFLANPAKIKVLACGRRWGKTDACAAQIAAALHRQSPTRHFLIAPTLSQARILFDRVVELMAALSELEQDPQEIKVRLTPHPSLAFGPHRLSARSGRLGFALRGNEATHIVIDEAAFVPQEIITEVALPMLATTNGELTLISTPKGRNHFWRFFRNGERGEHGVWSKTAPTSESPFVSQEFLAVQRELLSDRAFQVEYEAQFFDDAGRVFPTEALDACLVASLPGTKTKEPTLIGIDWGRYSDHTAIAVVTGYRDSAVLRKIVRLGHLPWAAQLERVADVVADYPGAIVLCDSTGVGDPVVEQLASLGLQATVREFKFTSASKTTLIDGLRWLIEKQALKMLPEPELLRELEYFEARPTATGTALEAASGYHDDLVIALALACSLLVRSYGTTIRLGEARNLAS